MTAKVDEPRHYKSEVDEPRHYKSEVDEPRHYGGALSSELPWDYHEDPIAWLNRRAAEMYRKEEA